MKRSRATSAQPAKRERRRLRLGAGSLAAAALIACSLPLASFCAISAASAETYTTAPTQADGGYSTTIENARARVDAAQEAYRQAQSAYASEGAKAYALELHANTLENLVPVQEERSDAAATELYKLQQGRYDILEMLLSSESIDDFVARTEYLDRLTKQCTAEVQRTQALIESVKKTRESIEGTRAAAAAHMNEAREEANAAAEALESVYASREERAALGRQRAVAEMRDAGGAKPDDANENNEGVVANAGVTENYEALDDGADWHMTEEEFVDEWAPRLDAYLEGSALAGQGKNFARSAWKYCIDPRWSAAISNIESSKGAICIRPHNAWGWGAADSDPYNLASEWGSWEEAIDAHARGLANGYGYTITVSGARAYCPPNWLTWYNTTVKEMAKI